MPGLGICVFPGFTKGEGGHGFALLVVLEMLLVFGIKERGGDRWKISALKPRRA